MPTKTQNSINLERHFDVPCEKVFSAWTNAALLSKWFAPSEHYTVIIEDLPAQLGGRYRINMKEKTGKDHIVTGVYEQFEKPELLQLTWAWDSDEEHFGENKVTLKFKDTGDSTQMTLNHEFFPDQETRDKHEKGWNAILDRLAAAL